MRYVQTSSAIVTSLLIISVVSLLVVDWCFIRKDHAQLAVKHITIALRRSAVNHYCITAPIDPRRKSRFEEYREFLNQIRAPSLYIAINLHNNEQILPDMVLQLQKLIECIGSKHIYISIFESGSSDQTRLQLELFHFLLNRLNVPHWIEHRSRLRMTNQHRIEYLSEVRNTALIPLWDQFMRGVRYRKILFLNDVFFCAEDALELLYQSERQQSDLACGLDFDIDDFGLGFYDTWVARDLNGHRFAKRPLNALTTDQPSNKALAASLPFQVGCCWNGLSVLNTAPFYTLREDGKYVGFRRVQSTLMDVNEPRFLDVQKAFPGERIYANCSGSEISNMCMDFHRLGFNRMIIVPHVKVAYTFQTYAALRSYEQSTAELRYNEDHMLTFERSPKAMYCLPMDSVTQRDPDGPEGYEAV